MIVVHHGEPEGTASKIYCMLLLADHGHGGGAAAAKNEADRRKRMQSFTKSERQPLFACFLFLPSQKPGLRAAPSQARWSEKERNLSLLLALVRCGWLVAALVGRFLKG